MSLYHEAAEILASSASEGGSLKSKVFKKKNLKNSPQQIYALVLETCKWSPILKEVVERSELLKHERKLSPLLSILLVHDLLLSKGGIALPQSHGLRASIERHKGRLTSELTLARLRRKAPTIQALRQQVDRESAGEEAKHPRWVRINALKSSVEDELETTFKNYVRAGSVQDVITKQDGKYFHIDEHVPNLFAITQGVDLTKTEAYKEGRIILQDKASCFPAYLLDPSIEDGDVVDACAAPGNKTTHLAAIIHSHRPEDEEAVSVAPQTVLAFEKDVNRAQTLEKMVRVAGSKDATKIAPGQDFLEIDPLAERYARVGALLLDPSCSGSGIVGRDSMPELHLPDAHSTASRSSKAITGKFSQVSRSSAKGGQKRKHDEVEQKSAPEVLVDDDGNETVIRSERDLQTRLDSLSNFQLKILLHAFRFPAATKVSYSTCSIHAQENEGVVMRALESGIARKRGWRILPREKQVSGMRDWLVRGDEAACGGNKEIAEGCIRSFKDDGRGVMGFFVAAFQRSGQEGPDGNGQGPGSHEGPYQRDETGVIIRDLMGMPVLRSTGKPVRLDEGQDETAEEEEEDGEGQQEWNGLGD